MTICEFVNVLLSCCDAVYHFEANQEKGDYIIWHEIGSKYLHADNRAAEEAVRIAVDFYSKKEFPDVPAKLKCAFNNSNSIAFRGPEIIYQQETKVKQYSYTVEVT